MTIATLDHLAAITLQELIAQAPALTRIDRKYLVPETLVPALFGDLDSSARVLEINGDREFDYRSLYFDSPSLESFRGAGQRRRRRFKVRIRTYLTSGENYLEVKTRGPRGTTVKEREPYAACTYLDRWGRSYLEDRFVHAGVTTSVEALQPVLLTAYRRSTLTVGADRATIDTGLSWARPHGPTLTTTGLAVIETKAGSTPTALDRLLWRHGHRPVRMSKFGAGLALLHPDLPRLKWHRTITSHLATHLAA